MLLQLVYASRPFGFDAGTLLSILLKSRANNEATDVTGCLICRDDLYLQMLEGPSNRVIETFNRIRNDDRHIEVTELLRQRIDDRLFGKWSMCDDPVRSWMWTRDQVEKGAVTTARPVEILRIFRRIAARANDNT